MMSKHTTQERKGMSGSKATRRKRTANREILKEGIRYYSGVYFHCSAFFLEMSASSIQVWGEGLVQGFAGRPSTFSINPNGLRMEGITFAIEGPSRPDFIFNHLPGGLVEVYYTATFPGSYRIHIKFFGRDVPGSPFSVDVMGDLESKVSMARDVIQNVKISGPAATNGKSLITNQFLLDARNAVVSGGLNASMEGPGNVQVGFKENLDGTIHVQYKPSHSGVYKLNLRFGDIPVVGSPFIINVN
ncbi:unnamed protein product [Allacma fusca]|uniref:Uncharacterized protein n=1 Tax=Allacma fusca TaxID=39272 RepID=A0A8J2J5A9_9HEXA|nr:unnamed protein product [Allacma fusca]